MDDSMQQLCSFGRPRKPRRAGERTASVLRKAAEGPRGQKNGITGWAWAGEDGLSAAGTVWLEQGWDSPDRCQALQESLDFLAIIRRHCAWGGGFKPPLPDFCSRLQTSFRPCWDWRIHPTRWMIVVWGLGVEEKIPKGTLESITPHLISLVNYYLTKSRI